MANFIKKILQRKILASGIALALIAGGYFGYTTIFSNEGVVRYVTAQVQKGTLIVSISGSGQVSTSNQVDLKSKASGDVVYIGVKNGQAVKRGALLLQLDAQDAREAVRDAELSLDTAELALDKAKRSAVDEQKSLKESALFNITSAFPVARKVLDNLNNVLFSDIPGQSKNLLEHYVNIVTSYENSNIDYEGAFTDAYQRARREYDAGVITISRVDHDSSLEDIQTVLDQTAEMIKITTDSVRIGYHLLERFETLLADNHASSTITVRNAAADRDQLKVDLSTINGYTADIFDIQKSMRTFADTKSSGSPFSVREQELTVRQRQNALIDAKEKLGDYFIRASFDGIITQLNVERGDSISPSTILGTLITKQKIAEISLNEVDVAQVKVGQKATLTFDAVPDLTITGQVAEIDAVGTVSQGVVTYNVKIAFDTQDERVKSAMSVSAAVITDAKPNILLVPNSAVKSQSNVHYVEIVKGEDSGTALAANVGGAILKNTPRRQTVEVGLSNDEFTEIVSGLKEGDAIVARTIQPSSQQPQTQQQSGGLRIPGLTGGGGR